MSALVNRLTLALSSLLLIGAASRLLVNAHRLPWEPLLFLVVGGVVMATLVRRLTTGVVILLLACAGLRLFAILYHLPWPIHDSLIYFPTWFDALSGILIATACIRRRLVRRSLLVATLLVLLANVIADFRPLWHRQPASDPTSGIQLLSYNIHQARWANDELLQFLCDRHPDIVCLQEVPVWFWESHEAELRKSFRCVVYHNHLLIATNLVPVASEQIELCHDRSLLHLAVEVDGQKLDVFNTHLSVAQPSNFFTRLDVQRRQTEEILAHVDPLPGPLLFAGDFNFPVHSSCYQRVTARYQNARGTVGTGVGYTFTTFLPITTIDHCFANAGVQFQSWETLPVRLSDHLPVLVRFSVSTETPTSIAARR
jgi:endonuclease/exonuclease/phosphatase (EEP) superfamily protein YafD